LNFNSVISFYKKISKRFSFLVFWYFLFAGGEQAFAAGWGLTSFYPIIRAQFLQVLAVKIIDFAQCNNEMRGRLSSHHICAGTMTANKSTSLVSNNKKRNQLYYHCIALINFYFLNA